MDLDGIIIEHQSEALTRILVALAAMAGLLEAARIGLPLDIHRALLRPLRAAEAAAARLPRQAGPHDPVAMARLRLRFLALCRAIAGLRRQLLRADSSLMREPVRKPRQPRADPQSFRPRTTDYADTS